MGSSIQVWYDYDLVKKYSKWGSVPLISSFQKNKLTKDGLNIQCKVCRKEYYSEGLVKQKTFI